MYKDDDVLPSGQDLSAGRAGGGITTAESHAQSTASRNGRKRMGIIN